MIVPNHRNGWAVDKQERVELTGNVNYVWDVSLTFYRRKIGDRTPGDAIGIPRNTYDADIRGGGEILNCIRLISIYISGRECHTVQ